MPNLSTPCSRFIGLRRTGPGVESSRFGVTLFTLALAAFVLPSPLLSGVAAQDDPNRFTLPEPEPSPTPATQGPVDERSGVPIAPRLIDPEPAQPAPEEQPAPPQSPPSPAGLAPDTAPASSDTDPETAPTSAPADPQTSSLTDIFNEAFSFDTSPENDPETARAPVAAEPSSRAPIDAGQARRAVGDQSAQPTGDAADQSVPFETGPQATPAPLPRSGFSLDGSGASAPFGPWLWALIAVCVIAFGAVVWLVMRSGKRQDGEARATWTAPALRQSEPDRQSEDGPDSQPDLQPTGANDEPTDDAGSDQPEGLRIEFLKEALSDHLEPSPVTTPVPARTSFPAANDRSPLPTSPSASSLPPVTPLISGERLPLAPSLSIVSAQRSLMNFCVEYRLALANRSDRALRELNAAVRLACARSEETHNASPAPNASVTRVERIGPHQSVTLTGSLELPIAQIQLIRQGRLPVFIPLLHVRVEGDGAGPSITRFVIGTPSAANQSRLQPIVLDTHIGGLANLRADLIQPFKAPDPVESAAR